VRVSAMLLAVVGAAVNIRLSNMGVAAVAADEVRA
jgi:hypothetical protein